MGQGWGGPPASTALATPGASASLGRKVFNMFFYSWLLEVRPHRLIAGGLIFPAFSGEKECKCIYKGT